MGLILTETSHSLVVIIIEIHRIWCAIITKGTYKKYTLMHVQEYTCKNLIASSGMLIYNTWIGFNIQQFLQRYNAINSPITIVCDDRIIPHGYTLTVEVSAHAYLTKHLSVPHHKLNTLYVCPHEEKFLSRWERVPYSLLLQIHLIGYTYQLNIISIRTDFPLLLETYKLMYGNNFRPSQLTIDLQRSHYEIASTIQPTIMHQFFESYYNHSLPHKLYALLLGAVTIETEVLYATE